MSCCMLNRLIIKHRIVPLKVRNSSGTRRIGIAVKSLNELHAKARKKFQVEKKRDVRFVDEEDGTEVDDDEYLQQLQPHTVLVILMDSEKWHGRRGLVEQAFHYMQRVSQLPTAYEEICHFMEAERDAGKLDLLGRWATCVRMNVDANMREEDPGWFTGVPVKFKTKESFLREKARCRMRGYFHITKDYISKTKCNGMTKRTLNKIVGHLLEELKEHDYQSDFFARSCEDRKLCLCDSDGWFTCEGVFDRDICDATDHRINPYGSREARILFSTWDLDHGVEKKRTILPTLVKAASSKEKIVNALYFYNLLFTRINLKIVHPVCHDKSEHKSALCDPQHIYTTS